MAQVGDKRQSNKDALGNDSFKREEKLEHLYKVLVIGDFGVGKERRPLPLLARSLS